MPGHAKWDLLRRLNNLPVSIRTEEMVAYTQGYILALEDVFKDVSTWYVSADSDRGPDYFDALISVRAQVDESLEDARATLEQLTKKKKEPDDVRVQGLPERSP